MIMDIIDGRLATSAKKEFGEELAGIMSKEGILLIDPSVCVVGMVLSLLDYAQSENCGKCIPCRIGSGTMHKIVAKILRGDAEENDIELLKILAGTAYRGSDCSFGEILGKIVLESLDKYRDEYIRHINSEATCKTTKYKGLHYTPCQVHCPLKTDIAYFIHAISMGSFTESRKYLDCVNYFPKSLGLVCGICKELCTLKDDPTGSIDINGLKSFVCDMPYRKGYKGYHYERASYNLSHSTHLIEPKPSKGKKIAIVGMGPAGLTAALFLLKKGYDVDGFEMYDEVGGLMLTGIPPERLPKDLLLEELNKVKSAGPGKFNLHLNTKIGVDIPVDSLWQDFDSVLLSPGSQSVMDLNLPGRKETKEGIYNFLYFLERVNRGKLENPGKKIGVIGGGNAAMDVSTAGRKFGSEVTVYYRKVQKMMPADPIEYDIAVEEGVKFEFQMTPKEYVHKNGKLVGVKFETPDKEIVFREMDAVVPSIGQYPDLSILPESHGLGVTPKEVVETNERGEATKPGVFSAGDFRVGRTVAHSMAEGIEAAIGIDKRLDPEGGETPVSEEINDKMINMARALCGEDPYIEELREHWNFSMKPAIRQKKPRSRLEASMREASACLRCRQIIVVAYNHEN